MAGSSGQTNGAEEAFDQSLEDFDDLMGSEREAMARTGVGTAADEAFGSAGTPGNAEGGEAGGEIPGITGQAGGATAAGGADSSGSVETGGNRGTSNEPARVAVEGCKDQDKVARQLCEAATEEQDPFLRAALWDEYNEYKRILARQ
jgi:hypothetical protein